MTDIWFYHLTQSRLEFALPKLLEKTLERDQRALVVVQNDQTRSSLNEWLWTYADDSFLPHGSEAEPQAEHQPIYLSPAMENANQAQFCFAVDGVELGDDAPFERFIYLFDANDNEAVTKARSYWKRLKESDQHSLSYWKQNEQGQWKKEA